MRLIDENALKEKGIPYHRVHLDRLAHRGKFPKPVKLGEGRGGRRRRIEEEVDAWGCGTRRGALGVNVMLKSISLAEVARWLSLSVCSETMSRRLLVQRGIRSRIPLRAGTRTSIEERRRQ